MHVISSTNTFVCASKLRLRTFETIVHYTAVHVISDLKLTIVSALGLLQCIYELERNLDSCHNATFTDMSVVWKFKTSHFLSHCTNQMLNVPGAGIWLVNRLVSTNERIVSDRRPNLCLASIDRKTRFDVSNSLGACWFDLMDITLVNVLPRVHRGEDSNPECIIKSIMQFTQRSVCHGAKKVKLLTLKNIKRSLLINSQV